MSRMKLMRAPSKYVQGVDSLKSFYNESKEIGNNFLFICSNSGHKACFDKIEESFKNSEAKRTYEIFGGISSVGEIERFRKIVKEKNIDAVVGIGGGSAIDTAKACAYYEKLPIIIVPTVSATDAPCTGLSVIYENDGTFNSYLFYPKNPDFVIVDTKVIAESPVKFLIAGMGDALGTYFEARACYKTDAPSLENGGITRSAMALCKLCYETLLEYGEEAVLSCENKVVTTALDAIVEASIYLSGVGADNGGLAVAHSVYNGFTALEECEKAMHGNIVAYGTIAQLIIEGAPKEELETVMNFCYKVGLPITLEEIGINDKERVRIAAKKATIEGETCHNMAGGVNEEQLYDALILADALGKKLKESKVK